MPLQPSDRIKLIKEVAYLLDSEEWPVIDLTLKHFGLPTSDDWTGAKYSYVMKMIADASDDVLAQLAKHVDLDYVASDVPVQPNFWTKGHFRLFISHLAKHRQKAAEIQEFLKPKGISSFVAHNDIEPTSEWQDVIELALATSDGMLALMHEEFHASNWTDQEIGYAMGRGILVIPVRLGQDPYGFIGRFQALNGFGRVSSALALTVFEILLKNKKTNRRMAESLVSLFEKSDSFAEAKTNAGLLSKTTHWDDALSRRCLEAVKSNYQIKESFSVQNHIMNMIRSKGYTVNTAV